MTRERYVLLGLARARAGWFRMVGQWSTSAALPAEFVRCVSVEELRTRLRSGRPFSAVLIDGATPGLDRDLVATAEEVGTAVVVVDGDGRDWRGLGVAAVLRSPFSRDELLEVLAASSRTIGSATLDDQQPAEPDIGDRGRFVAVTGPGGTGASTVAMALAQGLARGEGRTASRRPRSGSEADTARAERRADATSVLLADLRLSADLAMLHDSRVVVPGLQEVVEAHRTAAPTRSMLLDQTFDVPARGYRLLLGLRRHRHWTAIRPRALEATLDSMQALVDVVVADVGADVEGEAETGSVDVEERNLLARAAMVRADVVLVVGRPTLKGLHSLVRTIGELFAFGVPVERVLPVVTTAPRTPRARAELTTALADLLRAGATDTAADPVGALYLPTRPVDEALRDSVALPGALTRPLARAVTAMLERTGEVAAPQPQVPEPVAPGSMSAFTAEEHPS